MSYVVLARKYRPQIFEDLIGQEHVVTTLQNAIKTDRVHHAYLFTGARGVGKTTTARLLAKALNCETGPTDKPCGVCASCLGISAGSVSDVFEIDGASNTGVDNVRELRENVKYLPQSSRYKIYIIDEVHMLSTAAFNALLKTLEEPPAHVKFFFATTEPHKIPITILSRCQRFDFRKVANRELLERMKHILALEEISMGEDALRVVAREAQGSVRDALSLLDQVLSFGAHEKGDDAVFEALGAIDRRGVFALAEAILKRDGAAILKLVHEFDARSLEMREVAEHLIEHFRDILVCQTTDDLGAILDRSPGEIEELKVQSAMIEDGTLHRVFPQLLLVAEDVGRSRFAKITFETGLLRILQIAPTHSVEKLLQQLSDLLSSGEKKKSEPSVEDLERALTQPSPPLEEENQAEVRAAPVDEAKLESSSADKPNTETWRALVNRVQKMRPALASVLEHANALELGPNLVRLGFVPDSFHLEQARDEPMRIVMDRALEEHFGQKVKFQAVGVEGMELEGESLAEQRRRQQEEALELLRRQAREDPAVQAAVTALGAEVKEIRTLNNSDDN